MIEHDAILYGPAKPGKSCGICAYSTTNITRGLICQLHDERTSLSKCCGMFISGAKPSESDQEVNQGELF